MYRRCTCSKSGQAVFGSFVDCDRSEPEQSTGPNRLMACVELSPGTVTDRSDRELVSQLPLPPLIHSIHTMHTRGSVERCAGWCTPARSSRVLERNDEIDRGANVARRVARCVWLMNYFDRYIHIREERKRETRHAIENCRACKILVFLKFWFLMDWIRLVAGYFFYGPGTGWQG